MNDQSVNPIKTDSHLKLHIKRQFLTQSATILNNVINVVQGNIIFIVRNIHTHSTGQIARLLFTSSSEYSYNCALKG